MSHASLFRGLVSALMLLAIAAPLRAQTPEAAARFSFGPSAVDAEVPAPDVFLGHAPGEAFTLYADVVAYLKVLAAASDRVSMHAYGETYEGRPLHYLVVTSPANHARLDEIRRANLRLAEAEALPEAEAEALVAEQPVVVWLSYNVHGNEPSSTEAAMQVAYHLAAGTDERTRALLDEAVVVIDPCINPDGRDRYVYWYKSNRSHVLNDDAADLEHDEPWPGGRTNHYWFDLNRDWTWLVHPESQGRIAAYRTWLPQVHMDYHEQGFDSNYFTMPGTTPRNLNLPDDYDRWADVFGRANVAAFDRHRLTYATREAFDFFYPGYGSSYPSNLGAIGMLAEQGGHSRGGRAVETTDGYVLTLRQRVFDHYLTSLATVEAAVAHRAELLRYFRRFFTQAANEGPAAAYLIADDGGRGYAYDVVRILRAHDVRVERTEEPLTADAHAYWDGRPARRTFPAGTFVVPAAQPRHVLVNTLLQRQMAIEDSVMYDMATWSAPLAYNLDAAWTTTAPRVRTTVLAEDPAPPAGLEGPADAYAYVVDWSQRHAPKALAKLWEADYRVRSLREPFGDGTRTFSRGSLVVLAGRNLERADRMAADMARIAAEAGVRIVALPTGRMETGRDLASDESRPLEKPKVALLVDEPFSSYTAGQLWYLFDRWTEFGVSRVRAGALGGLDLSEYDVLLLPGAYGGLSEVLDSTTTARLRSWVREGGTLVATEGSALALTRDRSRFTSVERVREKPEEKPDEKKGDAEAAPKPSFYTTYAAREDSSGLARIPGSAFRAHLDVTHPLAFGLPERLYSLRFSTEALEPSDALQTVGYYDRDAGAVLASGYASAENRRLLAGKAFAAVQPMGRGRVVFLVDNTQYRMFWVGPARLVQNAVMLMPGM